MLFSWNTKYISTHLFWNKMVHVTAFAKSNRCELNQASLCLRKLISLWALNESSLLSSYFSLFHSKDRDSSKCCSIKDPPHWNCICLPAIQAMNSLCYQQRAGRNNKPYKTHWYCNVHIQLNGQNFPEVPLSPPVVLNILSLKSCGVHAFVPTAVPAYLSIHSWLQFAAADGLPCGFG